MSDLKERIAKAIRQIPASGGGVMDLYPTTLAHKLSDELIHKIASVAAEVATAPPPPA
jgi:hypothetical protein